MLAIFGLPERLSVLFLPLKPECLHLIRDVSCAVYVTAIMVKRFRVFFVTELFLNINSGQSPAEIELLIFAAFQLKDQRLVSAVHNQGLLYAEIKAGHRLAKKAL